MTTQIKHPLDICQEEIEGEAIKQGFTKDFGAWMFRYECYANYFFCDTENYEKFIDKWLPQTEKKFPKISNQTCLDFAEIANNIFMKHGIWLAPIPLNC